MSTMRLLVAAALLALMSAGAWSQVGIRIGGGGIGLGFGVAPSLGGGGRSDSGRRYRAPERSEHVRRKRNDDDDEVKTAKKKPAVEQVKEDDAQNENSGISSGAAAKGDGPKIAPVTETAETENSSITTAARTDTAAAGALEAKPAAGDAAVTSTSNGCRRFVAAVGAVISVPCE
jgi:hypothetical protein